MSVRRAKPSVTGDRAGREDAIRPLPARKDIVAVREEGHDCSVPIRLAITPLDDKHALLTEVDSTQTQ